MLAIKDFLAKSGAFLSLARRSPETVVTSGLLDPDQAIDAAINEYRRRGKSESWIALRLDGKVRREEFIRALRTAVIEYLNQSHYAIATDDIYVEWQFLLECKLNKPAAS